MFEVEVRPYDDADVRAMEAEVQAQYVELYGGPDAAAIDAAQFSPPAGIFLMGLLDGEPVAMGGWRRLADGSAEIKRMYVRATARRRGVGSALLAELERAARERGVSHIVLNTGPKQPAASAMYEAAGYRPTAPFGHYADHADALFFRRELTEPVSPTSPPIARPQGFAHVRLTVTDIHRSKAFYQRLFGMAPGSDFSDQIGDPTVRDDPTRTYGGCSFTFAGQTLGLRPVARPGDTFDPDRVGLDHVSFRLDTVAELHDAVQRLDEAGITHGEITELPRFGLVILSVQDPDDINLEFAAPLSPG